MATLLNHEDVECSIIAPLRSFGDIKVNEHSLALSTIERIEIRLVTIREDYPTVFDAFRIFETSGVDVSHELLRDPPLWSPKIGPEEKPEAIPIELLYDRLVTNETLRTATRKRFRDRNYADAVEAAFKCIEGAVKSMAGIANKSGADLMRHVFGDKSPFLAFSAMRSQSDRDEHSGYRDLFAGAMTGIRNPRAHEYALVDSPEVAIEFLALANHLMRKLDSTKTVTEYSGETP